MITNTYHWAWNNHVPRVFVERRAKRREGEEEGITEPLIHPSPQEQAPGVAPVLCAHLLPPLAGQVPEAPQKPPSPQLSVLELGKGPPREGAGWTESPGDTSASWPPQSWPEGSPPFLEAGQALEFYKGALCPVPTRACGSQAPCGSRILRTECVFTIWRCKRPHVCNGSRSPTAARTGLAPDAARPRHGPTLVWLSAETSPCRAPPPRLP